jgi:Na+(H+)/acetate symporter ActP
LTRLQPGASVPDSPAGRWATGRGRRGRFVWPWENPGIVSIPLGFAAAWLGTLLSREPSSEEKYEELRIRAFTGLGAEEVEAAEAVRS